MLIIPRYSNSRHVALLDFTVYFILFYLLQTDGLTIPAIVDEDKLNWDDKLDTVLMGHRASQQASTKQSPYYMLFQQQMRLRIDAKILSQSSTMDDGEDDSLKETVGAVFESRS